MSETDTATGGKQQLAAPMPTKMSVKPLKECRTLEEAFRTTEFMDRIASCVPQHVNPNRMLRTFVSAVNKAPLLAKADLRSFIGACLTLSQVGLEPNTPLQHAFLIPFQTKLYNKQTRRRDVDAVEINVIFGYPGLLDLSYRSGLVSSVHADVVWPGDEFSFEYGSDAHLRHRPKGLADTAKQPWVYAYMHAGLRDGQAFEVMPYSAVMAIRNRSQGYRSAVFALQNAQAAGRQPPASYTQAPWVAYEVAMARKTAFRAGSKWLPRSVELAAAVALDEGQERRQRMDFGSLLDAPTIDGQTDYLGEAASIANSSEEPDEGAPTGQDPGTAFTDRRSTQPQQQRQVEASAEPRETTPATTTTTEALGFEQYLVDQYGVPAEQPYFDPERYVDAIMTAYGRLSVTDGENLLQHNEDGLYEARKFPAAAAKLARLDTGGEQEARHPVAIEPIQPPVERGRTSWTGYVRLFRDALANVPGNQLPLWLEAQRPTLVTTPLAQRLAAIKAINETAAMARLALPSWLADMIKMPEPDRGSPTTQQAREEPPPNDGEGDLLGHAP